MTQKRPNCWKVCVFLAWSVAASPCPATVCAAAQRVEGTQTDPQRNNGRDRGRGGGFGPFDFGFVIGGGQGRKADPVKEVTDNGPQIPEEVSMSAFSVLGFCEGGWPVVIDYELEKPCQCWIEISNDLSDFYYRLDGGKTGPQTVVFNVPTRFGGKPNLARFVVRALTEGPGEVQPGPIRLYALGCGPTAVGSVTVDQITFRPESIRVKRKEAAAYSFRSLQDFGRAAVEFRNQYVFEGEERSRIAKRVDIKGGLKRDQTVGADKPKTWDGKDNKDRISTGRHRVLVYVWVNAAADRSWLCAYSREVVDVLKE